MVLWYTGAQSKPVLQWPSNPNSCSNESSNEKMDAGIVTNKGGFPEWKGMAIGHVLMQFEDAEYVITIHYTSVSV